MKKFFVLVHDYLFMIWGAITMFVFLKPSKHHLGHVVRGKCPIIVLPGILGKWAFIKPVIDGLSLDGHPVYIVPKLKSNLLEIPLSAKILHEMLEEQNISDAVIVAHSKGGLVGKYFLANYNEKKRVRGMVSLATPYSGSEMAKLVPHNAFLELLPDSLIVRELSRNKSINKKIISIMPSYDNHVWSEKGSYLKGALENIMVDVKGHHKIVFDKKTKEIVRKAVQKLSKI